MNRKLALTRSHLALGKISYQRAFRFQFPRKLMGQIHFQMPPSSSQLDLSNPCFRSRGLLRASSSLSLTAHSHTMTLTVATLNTTAEAIIHLLTLLQIFMHQLEGQEVVVEMEYKQGLMTHCNCKRWCNRFRSKRQSCTLWKTNLDLNRWPQALLSRPEARSCQQPRQGPRWFIVNPSCHRSPHNHPAGDRGGRRDSGAREPDGLLARQLLISRAGHQCDQLRPQAQARLLRPWCSRIRAMQWSLARYGSLMPEHQDFVRYGQLWMKEVGNDLWGSKVLMKKCKPQKNGHQQCDNFHAQVEQSIQHLENFMFTNFQGHSTHNCVYYLKSMPTPPVLWQKL